jgi:hypothetical protein
MFGFLAMLVERGIFKEIEVNFLPVGHTHEDIDTVFSLISQALKTCAAPNNAGAHRQHSEGGEGCSR